MKPLIRSQPSAVAFKKLMRAAEAGDGRAAYLVACSYSYGLTSEPNTKLAFEWAQRGRKLGSADAAALEAQYWAEGMVVSRDDAKALRLLRWGVRHGSDLAMLNLGIAQCRGQLGAMHKVAGRRLLRMAAQRGNSEAMYRLATSQMLDPRATRKTGVEGLRWLRRAAAKGSVASQLVLAEVYKRGLWCRRSVRLSEHWRQRSKKTERALGRLAAVPEFLF